MGKHFSKQRDSLRTLVTDPAFWPRAAILIGVGATITMNIAAGLGYGPGAAVVAAFIPVVFVIALESFIAVVRRCSRAWSIGAGCVLVPAAAIAGWVSWLHGHQVCLWTHNPDPQAQLIPFLPDLLIVCGTVALVALKIAAKTKPKTRTEPRPAQEPKPARKPPQPKPGQSAPRPRPAVLSQSVLGHLSPDQIKAEEAAAEKIAKLDVIPSERDIARDYFGRNRGAAKRTIARAVALRADNWDQTAATLTTVNGSGRTE